MEKTGRQAAISRSLRGYNVVVSCCRTDCARPHTRDTVQDVVRATD